MGRRDGVLSGYGHERWYSDWTLPDDDMVYRLDLGRRGGALIEYRQDRY